MTANHTPTILRWTAMGMRDKGMGEYVERHEYDALTARVAELEAALLTLADAVTTRRPEHEGYLSKCEREARAALAKGA